jgi:single-strand DNA-binding protein
MALSLNKVTLIGNVGRDPEIRTTGDGKDIATVSLATSDSWKDKVTGERREKTEWHRIVIFNEGLVSIVKNYIKKGSRIYIEGSLQTRKWQDATGIEKYATEVVLQNYGANLILLDSRSSSDGHHSDSSSNYTEQNFGHSELDDEIPF